MKKLFKKLLKKIVPEKTKISKPVCDTFFDNNERYFVLYNKIMKEQ